MNQKSQSAMEYLMTYGWSILIIAVVLGALAYLGVFNPLYFAPKAQPGSCQVFRPNGAGTSYDINLLGVCQGEVPEYVVHVTGFGKSFAYVKQFNIFGPSNAFTISFWTEPTGSYTQDWAIPLAMYGVFRFQTPYGSEYSGVPLTYELGSSNIGPSSLPNTADLFFNKWYFVSLSYNGLNAFYYINGNLVNNIEIAPTFGGLSNLVIGSLYGSVSEWNGSISNIQIYNISLGQNSIAALYQEGIGGAPIDLQNLVGWWPINGNANDYSGNGNDGITLNPFYTNTWWISGYNPP